MNWPVFWFQVNWSFFLIQSGGLCCLFDSRWIVFLFLFQQVNWLLIFIPAGELPCLFDSIRWTELYFWFQHMNYLSFWFQQVNWHVLLIPAGELTSYSEIDWLVSVGEGSLFPCLAEVREGVGRRGTGSWEILSPPPPARLFQHFNGSNFLN